MNVQRLVGSLMVAGALAACTPNSVPLMPSSLAVTWSPSAPRSTPSPAQPPTSSSVALAISSSAQKYLDAALDVMQRNAVNRSLLDWPAIRKRALEAASGATTPSGTYAAIALAVGQLDVNGHSSFIPLPAGPTVSLRALGPSQLPSGKVLPGQIGYIALPGVAEQFADQYRAAGTALMRTLLARHPEGWILDLRSNGGGDVWPMLGSVQPLLGSVLIGSFVSPPAPTSEVRITPTELTAGDEVTARISPALPQGASADPVVVLTGSITGSSGEFATIVFRGRPCTTSMGSATYGVPTANQDFYLSDGADLRLTTSFEADRTGHVYPPAPIEPKVEVGTNYNATWSRADPTIQAAARWLGLHGGCRP